MNIKITEYFLKQSAVEKANIISFLAAFLMSHNFIFSISSILNLYLHTELLFSSHLDIPY